mgnify:CR=1 FL=1
MQRVQYHRYGGPEVLRPEDVEALTEREVSHFPRNGKLIAVPD